MKLLYDKAPIKIWQGFTEQDAIELSVGTKWCTGDLTDSKNRLRAMFFSSRFNMYVIENTSLAYPLSKVGVMVDSQGHLHIVDANAKENIEQSKIVIPDGVLEKKPQSFEGRIKNAELFSKYIEQHFGGVNG